MTAQELTRFLDFLVNHVGFYEINEDEMVKKIKAEKHGVTVQDAASSIFKMNLDRGIKQVSIYALWQARKVFTEMDEVAKLGKIEDRCMKMISKVHVGAEAETILKLINEKVALKAKELKKEFDPFALEELRLATRRANGFLQVSFVRALPGDSPKRRKALDAIFYRRTKLEEPKVVLYGFEQ